MSPDEKQGTSVNFDLTIDDILAELDLLTPGQLSQSSQPTQSSQQPQPSAASEDAPPAPEAKAAAPAAQPVSPSLPAEETASAQSAEEEEFEEPLEEPATMVFAPQPKPVRQAKKPAASQRAAVQKTAPQQAARAAEKPAAQKPQAPQRAAGSARPAEKAPAQQPGASRSRQPAQIAPRPGSLREELARLSRTEGGHSMTEQLRAKDPQIIPISGGKAGKPAAAMTTTLVSDSAKRPIDWKREALEWGRSLLIAFAIVFLIFFVLIRLVNVEGSSMLPSLEEGDRLVISNLFYSPENGDIVVTSADNGLSKPLIKRVIAVEGQTVDLDEDGKIMVIGLVVEEPYLEDAVTDPGDLTFPVTVPEGCVFLLGDNRAHSTDSRSNEVGFVEEDDIKGRVLFRFFPFDRIGTVE